MNIAIFCSGNGTNFQAIVDACKKGLLKANIALMVCDNPQAFAVKRAEKENIKTLILERKDFQSKQEFEQKIIEALKKGKIELICLAGYMRMLSDDFVKTYRNRILNIHPALLPSFKGTHAIKDAIDYGVKTTGVTVHFVNEEMDAGPIILQESVKIKEDDTEDSLAERIHKIEHRLYPEAVRLFIEGKLKQSGRKIKILGAAIIFSLIFGFTAHAMLSRESTMPISTYGQGILSLSAEYALQDHDLLRISFPKNAKVGMDRPRSQTHDKLALSSAEIYDMQGLKISDPDNGKLLNPEIDTSRPLTKEEIKEMRIRNSIKIAEDIADLAESKEARFVSNGINGLISTAKKVISLRDHMSRKYNLHFSASSDEALIKYKKKF